MADLSLAVASAKQADFTDATPEGDAGIGSVAPENADALGTDATDDDFATATAFTMSAFAATVDCPSEASLQFEVTPPPPAPSLDEVSLQFEVVTPPGVPFLDEASLQTTFTFVATVA